MIGRSDRPGSKISEVDPFFGPFRVVLDQDLPRTRVESAFGPFYSRFYERWTAGTTLDSDYYGDQLSRRGRDQTFVDLGCGAGRVGPRGTMERKVTPTGVRVRTWVLPSSPAGSTDALFAQVRSTVPPHGALGPGRPTFWLSGELFYVPTKRGRLLGAPRFWGRPVRIP